MVFMKITVNRTMTGARKSQKQRYATRRRVGTRSDCVSRLACAETNWRWWVG